MKKRIIQLIINAICLLGILLVSNCQHIATYPDSKRSYVDSEKLKSKNSVACNEVILFCGNPGVGKSSLLNSIFQEPVFSSGISIGEGHTKEKLEHIYNNIKYIDTPGLADIKLREKAAQEIEKALKENNNYKIIFVVTFNAGKINYEDLVTINIICDAVAVPFEYGVIFNKVSKKVLELLSKNEEGLSIPLSFLHRQPVKQLFINFNEHMQDEANAFLSVKDRVELLRFIDGLPTTMVLNDNVQSVDASVHEARVKDMEINIAQQNEKAEIFKSLLEGIQEPRELRVIGENVRNIFLEVGRDKKPLISKLEKSTESLINELLDSHKEKLELTIGNLKNLFSQFIKNFNNLSGKISHLYEVLEGKLDIKNGTFQAKEWEVIASIKSLKDIFKKIDDKKKYHTGTGEIFSQSQLGGILSDLNKLLPESHEMQDLENCFTKLENALEELKNSKEQRVVEVLKSENFSYNDFIEECKLLRNNLIQLQENLKNLTIQSLSFEKKQTALHRHKDTFLQSQAIQEQRMERLMQEIIELIELFKKSNLSKNNNTSRGCIIQ